MQEKESINYFNGCTHHCCNACLGENKNLYVYIRIIICSMCPICKETYQISMDYPVRPFPLNYVQKFLSEFAKYKMSKKESTMKGVFDDVRIWY